MVVFNALFDGKKEIEYKGKIISRYFEINEPGDYKLRFTFISSNSEFNQAIEIFFNDFEGEFYVEGEKIKLKKTRFPHVVFWEDTAPKTFEVIIKLEKGDFFICNGSDPLGSKKFCHSLVYGCASYIEKMGENKYRFNCNDHECDDDLDDLVFEVEIERM